REHGLYVYLIRHDSHDFAKVSSIEERVSINFHSTIIVDKPINLNSGFVDLTDESSYYSSVLKEMILSNPIANDVAFAEKPEELLNIFIEDKNLNFNEFTNLILDVT